MKVFHNLFFTYLFYFAFIATGFARPCLAGDKSENTIQTYFAFAREPALTGQLSNEVRTLHGDIKAAVAHIEEAEEFRRVDRIQTQGFQDRINALFADRIAVLAVLGPGTTPSMPATETAVYRSAGSSALEDLTMLIRLSKWLWTYDSQLDLNFRTNKVENIAFTLASVPPGFLGFLLGFLSVTPETNFLGHVGGFALGVSGAFALMFALERAGKSDLVWDYITFFFTPVFLDRYRSAIGEQVFEALATSLEQSIQRKLTRKERKKLRSALNQDETCPEEITAFCAQLLESGAPAPTRGPRVAHALDSDESGLDSEGAPELDYDEVGLAVKRQRRAL